MVKVKEDLTGKRFGKLTVIEQAEDYVRKNGRHDAQWKCLCECGNYKIVRGYSLKLGNTKSCGCLAYENISTLSKRYRHRDNIYEFYQDYGICYTYDKKYKWLFDLEDYEKIKDIYWNAINSRGMKNQHYAAGTDTIKHKTVLMSRIVMDLSDNDKRQIDHINHDITDNRKNNLRICSTFENCVNKGIFSNNTSGVTGVDWSKNRNKWRARISNHGHDYTIGFFNDINDAIIARKKAEQEFWGDFTYDNSINYRKVGELNDIS